MRNYNMHSMSKTIAKLHVMLIEYEKELPRKSATSQVLRIKGERSRKQINRKLRARFLVRGNKLCLSQNLKRPFGKRSIRLKYLAELNAKKKQAGSASASSIFKN